MKLIIWAFFIAVPLFAQKESVNDSLAQELEKVNRKLKKLEYENLLLEKSELERKLGIESVPHAAMNTQDTLATNTEIEFGGGGGPSVGLVVLDLSPVKDMISNNIAMFREESPYYSLSVEESIAGTYENFFIVGGGGYAELGKGFRIGGAGYGAFRFYDLQNSEKRLKISLGYGGAVLEKAFYKKRLEVALGTLLGGGGFTTELINPAGNSFPTVNSASLFTGDIHASGSFRINSIFKVGIELFALLLASESGFETGENFSTFNGGIRLQLFFGSHGM